MAGGEVCKQTACVIRFEPKVPETLLDIPAAELSECCFELPVFAKTSGGDEFTDDVNRFLLSYGRGITAVDLYLQKYVSDTWTDQVQLNDNTYGTFYALGFFEDVSNDFQYIGYELEWATVLSAFGEGSYRIRTDETKLIGGTIENILDTYCLLTYTAERANGTVRFDYTLSGIIGDKSAYDKTILYPNSWTNQLRVPGWFGEESSPEYEREYVRFTNGQQVYVSDNQKISFTFTSYKDFYPASVHKTLKTDVLQADEIKVTDYNANQTDVFKLVPVKPTSAYEPNWKRNISKKASIELTFEPEFDVFRKKRC